MEEVKIKRVNYKCYCIEYEDVCIEIHPRSIGFDQIDYLFPVVKAAHGIACGNDVKDDYHP